MESVHSVNVAFKLLPDESVQGPESTEMMAMKRRSTAAPADHRHLPPLRDVPASTRAHAYCVLPPDYELALSPDFAV